MKLTIFLTKEVEGTEEAKECVEKIKEVLDETYQIQSRVTELI